MQLLLIFQIIVSVTLISVILLQAKGTGLGSAFGGTGASYHSRRGIEKVLFKLTIALSIIFIFIALISLV